MLLGGGRYEGNANQIGFPVGVYTQNAEAACLAWGLLLVRGDIGGSLASIQKSSDEPYQNFVDRLLIAASRILGDSDMGSPFIMQLAYENANAACCAAIRLHKGQTDLVGYIQLCAEIGPSGNQGLAFTATLQGTTVVQAMLSQKRGNNACFKCGSLGHFKSACPKNKVPRVGKQAMPQEFVPGAVRAATGQGSASLNQVF